MAEKKVLIVDGDGTSRKYLAGILEEKQCHVLEASLGKEGLIYAWRDHPDLILVDPKLVDLPGEDLIRKLRADARTADVPAIAISSDHSPQRKDACLEAGFNEYLNKSADSIPALMEAIDRWLATTDDFSFDNEEKDQKGGMLFVFLSAKGGTGTSSLCANLAMGISLHRPSASVVVLDSVLPIGSISSIVGYDGQMNLVSFAALPPEKTDEAFFRDSLPNQPAWRFRLVAGAPDPESAASLRGERIVQIVQKLRATYDYVFIDIGRSLSNMVLPIIQQADLVALVISPDIGAVKLTRTIWQYLQSKGLSTKNIFTILNRVVGFEGVTKPEVEGLLNLTIQATIPHLGGNFSLANNQHVPLALKFPGDSSAMILKEAAAQMMTMADRVRSDTQRGGQNVGRI
jgi:MinD-like ATPase involved in chromosome partitioning or flagellar assembly/CheY-like chemotaxis protein